MLGGGRSQVYLVLFFDYAPYKYTFEISRHLQLSKDTYSDAFTAEFQKDVKCPGS